MKDIVIKKFYEIDKKLFDICYHETWQLCCDFDGINDHPNFLEDDFHCTWINPACTMPLMFPQELL